MRRQIVRSAVVFGVSGMLMIGVQAVVCAQQQVSQEELLKEIRELKETVKQQAGRIEALEQRVSSQQVPIASAEAGKETCAELPKKIDEHRAEKPQEPTLLQGLEFEGWATMIVQGAHNANGQEQLSRREDVTDASYTADITIEKKFQDADKGFIHFRAGNGIGVTDNLQLFSSVNYNAVDTSDTVRITELWYEHCFNPAPLTLTVGKIDPLSYIDDNAYAYDETTQFLGDMFANSPVIEFPSSNGETGVRASAKLSDALAVELLATDSKASGEDVFDSLFLAGQCTFSPKIGVRGGNYRLIVWRNGANHTRWSDSTRTKEDGYGWGLSFDQECTDILGVFARYGWQNPDVYLNENSFSLEQAYSFGPQVKGTAWGRPDDTIGLAWGQVFPSKKYKEANSLIAKAESHLESYYNFKVNQHFSLSPDVQIIWQPYGKDAANGDGTIVVTGVRGEVDF